MTPPEAPANGSDAGRETRPPAVSVRLDPGALPALETLTKRADFLACARARKAVTPAFILQARRRSDENAPALVRVGFTASKKVGNAVARNRAKRRLREIARLALPSAGTPGWDYVLVARKDVTARNLFSEMQADLIRALKQVHASRNSRNATNPKG